MYRDWLSMCAGEIEEAGIKAEISGRAKHFFLHL